VCLRPALTQLRRVDMVCGPIDFCDPCGQDALDSGVFALVVQ